MSEARMDQIPRKLVRWCCFLLGYGFLIRAIFGFVFGPTHEGVMRIGVAALISLSSFVMAMTIKEDRS